jgi:predicted nucleic acid-binding Zn ribbon protein
VLAKKMYAKGESHSDIANALGVPGGHLSAYFKGVLLDKKKCPICGVSFQPSSRRQMVCSSQCRSDKYNKNWREKNPLKVKACCVCGKRFHPAATHTTCSDACSKAKNRRLQRERRKNDIKYKLSCVMRTGIYAGLKSVGASKKGESSLKLVGYSVEDLKRHLEKKFKKGMSWDNYGTVWEIDHILPISAFIIKSAHDVAFRECWALKNLQPLWKEENNKKSAKLYKPFQHQLPMQINTCF